MIAELTSCPVAGHSSAGADKSLSLLVWIDSTPRQEGFQVSFHDDLKPGDDTPRPGIRDADHPGGLGGHRALAAAAGRSGWNSLANVLRMAGGVSVARASSVPPGVAGAVLGESS